jgi:hydrogenase maturation protein HypF
VVARIEILVRGIVQGVGFRPFVYGLARGMGLRGYVTNTGGGVLIEVEGADIDAFVLRLRAEAPPLSLITDIATRALAPCGYPDFTIRASVEGGGASPFTLVSPDVSTCDDCLRELLDPEDRRHRYPFINCTNCGPRYSITRSVPYDRPNTTMASFAMCPDCAREYHDPGDRRFHAQPNACPACGPHLEFRAGSSRIAGDDEAALAACIRFLRGGGITAIKGLGGFHLGCDATDEGAVARLRERKRKSNKPFAVMVADLAAARSLCVVDEVEARALQSTRRPIVLLRRRDPSPLSWAIAPGVDRIGCMLPYTPLHYLLFNAEPSRAPMSDESPEGEGNRIPDFTALVMTSGNLAEEPIVCSNEQALEKLSGLVDGFLFHDRGIFMRVDDSVLRLRSFPAAPSGPGRSGQPDPGLSFIRRSRGYAPDPIELIGEGPEVLGCGADLKNTFTLTKGGFAIVSQHVGDMENQETLAFFEECLANLEAVYRVEPRAVAYDLHPGYLSTGWAEDLLERSGGTLRGFPVQHHYAHIASVMAEHGLGEERVIGVAFDGTGYGSDGRLWGGEFLLADVRGFERLGHLKYLPLPGGEAAIREPWRTAVSLVRDLAGEDAPRILAGLGFAATYGEATVGQVLSIAGARDFSPLSSGAGRLFDAVSALLGICDRNSFEGEAAMALEAWASEGVEGEYPVDYLRGEGPLVVDYAPMTAAIVRDIEGQRTVAEIASRFHNTIASIILSVVGEASELHGVRKVALSGGAFQNALLLARTVGLLRSKGLEVYINGEVPCNDACVSLGQAWLARERMRTG